MNKVMIAMSGGTDSAVTAHLIKNAGYDAIGATAVMFNRADARFMASPSSDVEDAKRVAELCGIEHKIFDLTTAFEKYVIDEFIRAYIAGETPNPCVVCNKHIKFGELLDIADALGIHYIASGHYARIERQGERYLLRKGVDDKKDQTYVLWQLDQHQLSRTLLPLGNYKKDEVQKIAEEMNFFRERKKESQDICFIPDGNYAEFIRRFADIKFEIGNYIDTEGRILGKHTGAVKYTIGQRKGLGIALGEPMYVISKDMQANTVTLAREEKLFGRELDAKDINFIAFDKLDSPIKVEAKIRYSHSSAKATLEQTDENSFHLEFDEEQRAITKGQSVVLYDGDYVLGGGIIK